MVVESSGHYWWPLASHLRRLQRSKSDPADARTLAALGMRDQPPVREPLVGAEAKEAARFCMRLVKDQANVCQRLLRLVEIGFPELKEAFEDPTCDSALAILRQSPTARQATRRRLGTLARAVGVVKARRIQDLASQTIPAIVQDFWFGICQ